MEAANITPEYLVNRLHEFGYTHWERGWIYGVWYCGTAFQKAIYYGQFPLTFVKRVTTMFPPDRLDFLHLCCGRCHIDNAVNVDLMLLPEVDLRANAEQLPFSCQAFDVTLVDPPYSEEDSSRYGVPMLISSRKTMKEIHRCTKPGGWLLWLDEKYPQFRKAEWNLTGLIGIVTGAGRRVRVLSMFQKVEAEDAL